MTKEKKIKVKMPNGKVVEGLVLGEGKMNAHDSKLWNAAFESGKAQARQEVLEKIDKIMDSWEIFAQMNKKTLHIIEGIHRELKQKLQEGSK